MRDGWWPGIDAEPSPAPRRLTARYTHIRPPEPGIHSAKSELVGVSWRSLSVYFNITPQRRATGVAGPEYQSIQPGVHVMKTFTLISIALVLCGSILSVAKAARPSDIPTAVVKFGDLDTMHPAGKKELYRRLSRATREVCSSLEGTSGSRLFPAPQYEACIDRALSGAVAQINRPDFTDYVATLAHKPTSVDTRLAAR
jgi:UrcA family protein